LGKSKDMTDEQLADELRERGHTEAANALARKLTAGEAAAAPTRGDG
jgi:hypothetical protein